jgi:hypothetical protein
MARRIEVHFYFMSERIEFLIDSMLSGDLLHCQLSIMKKVSARLTCTKNIELNTCDCAYAGFRHTKVNRVKALL